ncbi:putative carboxylesterase [Diplodia seriata]|uniref:Carboxylic ester hydrolase n=1 Tax=Diplodia seriata TaxID=420778 RepID=A0A0G2DWL2_9PEZI|nr:putative carboxylesterase [Diplodia seriata]
MKANVITAVVTSQACLASAALYNQTIQTQYGTVQGIAAFESEPINNISNWKDVTVWKGIPFAADTSGQNRFRPPQKRAAWNSTLYANEFGDVCPSGSLNFGGGPTKRQATSGSDATTGEDCLNLNIWSAANSTDAKLPVMIWSYPAGGSAAQSLFDGGGMAAKGVVFVNYNYRGGALGWLAHAQLGSEMVDEVGKNVSGNWAMLDQFAVVKWVHENIAAFGGDPEQITVAGQSAGSAAAYHMVNSPLTKGLIKGAIVESGIRYPFDPLCSTLAENYRNMTTALATGASLMASLNVSTIDQLRQLPLDTLNSASGSFGAVLDYWAMPDTYYNTMVNGPANDVPLITGNTKDESGASLPINITVSAYIQDLQTQYGDAYAQRFLALYPAANGTQAGMSFNAHYRDTSRVSSWLYANGWDASAGTASPIYTYYWDHAPPGQDRGAYHESEICYALGNLYGTDYPWEERDFAIAETMSAYWANFAKTRDPNAGGSYAGTGALPRWRESSPERNVTMRLGDGWGDVPLASAEQIGLLAEFFATQPAF